MNFREAAASFIIPWILHLCFYFRRDIGFLCPQRVQIFLEYMLIQVLVTGEMSFMNGIQIGVAVEIFIDLVLLNNINCNVGTVIGDTFHVVQKLDERDTIIYCTGFILQTVNMILAEDICKYIDNLFQRFNSCDCLRCFRIESYQRRCRTCTLLSPKG